MAQKRRQSPRARRVARVGASPFPTEPELVVIATPRAGLRARGATVEGAPAADADGLRQILAAAGASMLPIFGATEVRARDAMSSLAAAHPALPDLATYYHVTAPPDRLPALAQQLAAHPAVEAAFVKPGAEPPVWVDDDGVAAPSTLDAPPATADFNARQGYLDVAPGGIDARYAWTRAGGRGQNVRIIDIEGAWRFSHEDLLQNQGGVIGGTQSTDLGWRNHGTAVVGEFGGDENGLGVIGICPLANVRAISIFGGTGSAGAIRSAADALGPGDVILIELHRPGPRHAFASRLDQAGYIAIEWWPDDFAAILYATSRGVIVVEAAGNGAENLDDAIYNVRATGFPAAWRNPFNRANPQCGAIVVGAGAPPPGTHGRNHGADRSRLGFSNFGACVDVQGWGREVTTTGGRGGAAGDLQGGGNEDLWYTDTFSGTSSASPIVVGAIGCMQGALRAAGRPLLTPATSRDILRNTGSPQQDEPGRPASQRIGNRPSLRAALTRLLPIKIKDFKEKELKEFKEKERKEKEFIKEIKDARKERKEKEFKEGSKDLKEPKEFKEPKELKDIRETKIRDLKVRDLSGPSPAADPDLAERVSLLEQTVHQLAHFIGNDLRPDLQAAALYDDEGVAAQQQQQADLAKQSKDAADYTQPTGS